MKAARLFPALRVSLSFTVSLAVVLLTFVLLPEQGLAQRKPAKPATRSKLDPAPKADAKPDKPGKQTPEQKAAEKILKSLDLHDRIAQLIIGVCYGDVPAAGTKDYEKLRHWVRDLHVGGLIMVNRVQYGLARNAEPHAFAVFLNQMQRLAKTPLIIGADFERGASMRVSDTVKYPHNMAYAAARSPEGSRFEGLMTAREARAMGVHWVFAPDADVNVNPENPVIGIRAYSENPDEVAEHVAAFIDGAHSDPDNFVLLSAKHFPGHGDTSVDSHLDLARLDASKERMEAVELKPFRAAIEHDVDSIMTAHMTVPAYEDRPIPATVSMPILNGLLRRELGFKGLIVTDAMDMQGLAKLYNSGEASVRALQAGADVLLMPPDPERAIRVLIGAVEDGRLTRKRIDESVMRILEAKVRVGLMKSKQVNLDTVSDGLESEQAAAHAQDIADRAITLIKNQSAEGAAVLPLRRTDSTCLVISSGVRNSSFGLLLAAEFRRRAPQSKTIVVDNAMPLAAMEAMVPDWTQCSAIVFATYTTNPTLPTDLAAFVDKRTSGPAPVVFLSFGNPYLGRAFPNAAAYLMTFSTAPTSETAAAKALVGEIAITGHLPVSIPFPMPADAGTGMEGMQAGGMNRNGMNGSGMTGGACCGPRANAPENGTATGSNANTALSDAGSRGYLARYGDGIQLPKAR
jgi:beta-N-acetylhexosaminidase